MAGQGGARAGAGTKGIPDHLKLIKGTFRKSRAKDKPEPSKDKPIAPSHLNSRALYHFGRIVDLLEDRASATFVDIIATLAIRLEECERYYGIIYETPFFQTEDQFGNKVLKNHPLSVQYKEAMRHSHTLLSEVGLTPASIGRMGGKKIESPADPWDEL